MIYKYHNVLSMMAQISLMTVKMMAAHLDGVLKIM